MYVCVCVCIYKYIYIYISICVRVLYRIKTTFFCITQFFDCPPIEFDKGSVAFLKNRLLNYKKIILFLLTFDKNL